MERLHWVQHRCRQLLEGDSARGWYSPAAEGPPSKNSQDAAGSTRRRRRKRRTVLACHGAQQQQQMYDSGSKSYKGNAICTTKYNWLTFIPVNLFQQFRR